ncbi:MAG: hypothetical protein C5B43_01295 [Verrucomicrobia bacterium]|nr:MAG: hypothetical protein C5B43_01295 [Verrucomicrobiota bacterium]
MTTITTITHIAKPQDSRCKWFQSIIPDNITADALTDGVKLNYLRKGADLELEQGQFLIDSEANHHRNERGYRVMIGIALGDSVKWLIPNMKIKMLIKSEGHADLMKGSGDVNACFRIALYLRRQENLQESFLKLQNLIKE